MHADSSTVIPASSHHLCHEDDKCGDVSTCTCIRKDDTYFKSDGSTPLPIHMNMSNPAIQVREDKNE